MIMAMGKCLRVFLFAICGLQATLAVKQGYGYSCMIVDAPSAVCPKAKSFVQGLNETIVKPIIGAIEQSLENMKSLPGISANCSNALQKYMCTFLPQCVSYKEPFHFNVTGSSMACQNIDVACSIPLCQTLKGSAVGMEQISNWTCAVVNDPSDFCPNVTYKAATFGNVVMAFEFANLKKSLEKYKDNITKECYDSVKEFGCYFARGPVCSDDETYFMSPINKDECKQKFACLPKTYGPNGTLEFPHAACDGLPSASAIRVPIPSNFAAEVGPTDPSSKNTTEVVTTDPSGNNPTGVGPTDDGAMLKPLLCLSLIVMLISTTFSN